MRLFVIWVLLVIEAQYNFIQNKGLIATTMLCLGATAAIAQDYKELFK